MKWAAGVYQAWEQHEGGDWPQCSQHVPPPPPPLALESKPLLALCPISDEGRLLLRRDPSNFPCPGTAGEDSALCCGDRYTLQSPGGNTIRGACPLPAAPVRSACTAVQESGSQGLREHTRCVSAPFGQRKLPGTDCGVARGWEGGAAGPELACIHQRGSSKPPRALSQTSAPRVAVPQLQLQAALLQYSAWSLPDHPPVVPRQERYREVFKGF